MTTYILDTGIVLGYIRAAGYANYVEREFAVTQLPNIALISVVTLGEIQSIALQFGWSAEKKQKLTDILNKIPAVGLNNPQIIEMYAEIDAYSQGKHPKELPQGLSSRNMGKNDIWIAATGSVIKATLLTTDTHFDHLDGVFLKVIYVDQNLK